MRKWMDLVQHQAFHQTDVMLLHSRACKKKGNEIREKINGQIGDWRWTRNHETEQVNNSN